MADKKLIETIMKRAMIASQEELYASIGKALVKPKKVLKKGK